MAGVSFQQLLFEVKRNKSVKRDKLTITCD